MADQADFDAKVKGATPKAGLGEKVAGGAMNAAKNVGASVGGFAFNVGKKVFKWSVIVASLGAAGYYGARAYFGGEKVDKAIGIGTKGWDTASRLVNDIAPSTNPNGTENSQKIAKIDAEKKAKQNADAATKPAVGSGQPPAQVAQSAPPKQGEFGAAGDVKAPNEANAPAGDKTNKSVKPEFPDSAEAFAKLKPEYAKDGRVDFDAIQKAASKKVNDLGLNYPDAGTNYMKALSVLKVIVPPNAENFLPEGGQKQALRRTILRNADAFVKAFNASYGKEKPLGDDAAETRALQAGLEAVFVDRKNNPPPAITQQQTSPAPAR